MEYPLPRNVPLKLGMGRSWSPPAKCRHPAQRFYLPTTYRACSFCSGEPSRRARRSFAANSRSCPARRRNTKQARSDPARPVQNSAGLAQIGTAPDLSAGRDDSFSPPVSAVHARRNPRPAHIPKTSQPASLSLKTALQTPLDPKQSPESPLDRSHLRKSRMIMSRRRKERKRRRDGHCIKNAPGASNVPGTYMVGA